MPYALVLLGFVSAVLLSRIGVPVSATVRASLVCSSAGLAGAAVRVAFLWPTSFLIEHVLRRASSARREFRGLALGLLAVGLYVYGPVDVLSRCELVSPGLADHAAIAVPSGLYVFAAVPLLLVWLGLVIFGKRR